MVWFCEYITSGSVKLTFPLHTSFFQLFCRQYLPDSTIPQGLAIHYIQVATNVHNREESVEKDPTGQIFGIWSIVYVVWAIFEEI
jgi:hypothetical protein